MIPEHTGHIKKNISMAENKDYEGFIYILNNPSLEGMVKIGATTKDPNDKCRELSSNPSIPTQFNIVYYLSSINPFKVVGIVHTILDEYRVNKSRDFFKVDVAQTVNLIEDIEKMLSTNYNASSIGRYEVVGSVLENRTELEGKRFNTVEELTSMGIDERFIFDNEKGKCLIGCIPKARPKLKVKWRYFNADNI